MDEHPVTMAIETERKKPRMSPPNIFRLLEVRRRVDHHHAHLVGARLEAVRHVRRKKAGVARPHLEFFAPDFNAGSAFEQVANLLDAGVRVRSRALPALDLADDDFDLFRSDQAIVLRPGVVRRRVRRNVRLPDQVLDGGIQLCRAMPPSTRIDAPVT
jgi:hypothetical protein